MLERYQKKFIGIILILALVISLMPAVTLTASADSSVTFDFDTATANSNSKTVTQTVSSNTIKLVSSNANIKYDEHNTYGLDIPNGSEIRGGFVMNDPVGYEKKVVISLSSGNLFNLNSIDMINVFGADKNVVLTAKRGRTTVGTVSRFLSGNDAYHFNTSSDVNFQNISSVEITSPYMDNELHLAFDNIVLNSIHTPKAPDVQSKDITFSNVAQTSMNIGWTPGSGSHSAVFVKEGTGDIVNPIDGTTYLASTNWSSKGTQLGSSDYYCVYNGTDTSVTLTGLSPNTQYTVQVFDYNGLPTETKYMTSSAVNNPSSQLTLIPEISITRDSSEITKDSSIRWNVTFADALTGLKASNFNLSGTSTGTISSVTGSGSTYTVTANSVSGDGTLGLNLSNSTGLSPTLTNVPFTGESYRIDKTPPTISIGAPSASITATWPVIYTVTYADTNFKTSNLVSENIKLNKTGSANGTISVSGSGLTRDVIIGDISGEGTLGISIDAGTGSDTAGNTAPTAGPSTTFIVDDTLPTIDTQPAMATVTAGDKTSFTVGATGLDLEYQWQVKLPGNNNFFNIDDGISYIGSKTPTLTIVKTVDEMDGRVYQCVVTGSNGLSVTSSSAKLKVNTPPTISTQPSNSIIKVGENTSFAVEASATGIQYQWQVKKGGSFTDVIDDNIYSGAKTATLSIKEAPGAMNGLIYRVVISGTVPAPVTSNPVTLTVHTPPDININTPCDSAVAVDGSTSFTVVAAGENLEYQWQVKSGNNWFNTGDGLSYNGSRTPTLKITKASANMNGRVFQCIVTGEGGLSSTSRSATLSVGTVITQAVSGIHSTTATGNGNITILVVPNPIQHGVVWSTSANPDVSLTTKTEQGVVNSIGAFTSNMTGLSPHTTYHVRAYATNAEGTIYGSDVTFTTSASLGGGSATSTASRNTGANVNEQNQGFGSSSTATTNGKTVTTITVDDTKLAKFLESSGVKPTVMLQANSGSDVVVGQLNGQMVKNMEAKSAILEIKTESVIYTLPVSQIYIGSVSSQIGAQVELKDIKVCVKIADPSADTVKVVQDTANKNGYQLVAKPVEFEITCTSGDKTIEVSKFNGYIERTVVIPDGVDPSKIITGVVVGKDGSFSHVPTAIVVIDGKYYAKINSLTNSTYAVVYNPVTFTDVANHWAKTSIYDMGSRMVVSGDETGNYHPDNNITRAEFAAIFVRAMGLTKGTTESSFTDITLSDWFNGYVDTAMSYGLITGYDATSYGPNDMITREQAMAVIERAMTKTGLSVSLTDSEVSAVLAKYTDAAAVSDYAKKSVAACLKNEIITGSSVSMLSPKTYVTRAEVAVMVQRLLQKSNLI